MTENSIVPSLQRARDAAIEALHSQSAGRLHLAAGPGHVEQAYVVHYTVNEQHGTRLFERREGLLIDK